MRVNIYRTCGHLDRQFVEQKWFSNAIKAETYCKYIAPKLHGYGEYSFVIKY